MHLLCALRLLITWQILVATTILAYHYDSDYIAFNLNQNETATDALDYYGIWDDHTFQPSPTNWRFPFYTIFVDRFVNGNPTNDNINGTMFEQDLLQTQLRHGGDLQGIVDSLDYIQGIGIKGLYLAGSPMINIPWAADQYSPLDLSILDMHLGNISEWRNFVTEVHNRGMYIILDNTFATLGDLVGFEGYLNSSAPFTLTEHTALWKNDRRYWDFEINNDKYNETCQYPRFWLDTGYPLGTDVTSQLKGCYDSEFDQYGDVEAFGVHPDWQRQLAKFASVQDRLREWKPSVREKLKTFSCNMIRMLDIDGFRIDKATQGTADALGDFSKAMRACARSLGKENFFIPDEITGGNNFGSIYLGRGKQPNMQYTSLTEAVSANQTNSNSTFIRDSTDQALDSAAFHYSVYRLLIRFLGMDGNLLASYDTPVDLVQTWTAILQTNDLINPSTNIVDPRHMYGVTNQDVFRWPAITLGTERMLLGLYVTTLLLPGIPLLLWGEEQSFYLLDNTAPNYMYGRQAMSYSNAWQIHGCYKVGSLTYYEMPLDAALRGCTDDWNSLDHRDPTAPVRNTLRAMYQMRQSYPVLNDGFYLQELSKRTRDILYPGSSGVPTETGIWSIMRSAFQPIQNFTGIGPGNQPVWLIYHNDNVTVDYTFDCSQNETAIIAPFDSGQVVKNLFYPFDEMTLLPSPQTLHFNGSTIPNGCVKQVALEPYAFRAYVQKDAWIGLNPSVVDAIPSHDARIRSAALPGQQETISLQLAFSMPMSCAGVASSLSFTSRTEDGSTPYLDYGSINCTLLAEANVKSSLTGVPAALWTFKANLLGVANGIHSFTVRNASNADGTRFTDAFDKFLFRTGQIDNPMVFPAILNYTEQLLHQDPQGNLFFSHKAAGADRYRYSLNWASSWSEWLPYNGGNSTLAPQAWSGTDRQAWAGDHVIVQYYSQLTSSASYQQHADLSGPQMTFQRRFPHIFAHGPFNQFGYDSGLSDTLSLIGDGLWRFDFVTEWPAVFQLNVWGINPDTQPDQTAVFGDVDGDNILDRVPPTSLAGSLLNLSIAPPMPYLGWRVTLTDGDLRFTVEPAGTMTKQLIIFIFLLLLPPLTGSLAVHLFKRSFYQVKMNKFGVSKEKTTLPQFIQTPIKKLSLPHRLLQSKSSTSLALHKLRPTKFSQSALSNEIGSEKRRTVLIATMEYDIEDWGIKIKIGGLGVMAQLMGKSLGHQDLVWVVPCVGGIDYPEDEPAPSMNVTIVGKRYEVKTKTEPYPPRMDDLTSAIYYSAWNQCIALALKRFKVDIYHINDYHGALAPIHLLPKTIPVALSLHNAEFQGLWPMRELSEVEEVCEVFNISTTLARKYVQFGEVFNLLHAGSSYLRLHQKGFGAVGVSKKYGKRSWARYPIFWGLAEIGQLPNPDPSDTQEWSGKQDTSQAVIDLELERQRKELRKQAQEWANLNVDEDAELFVFVGRWSMQKGIDLIADVMPSILEQYKNAQLICIGPVIDLHGKFAALKLGVMMEKYPGRVCSKPVFTVLPPYIFSGAEWALIPSRDEPFGLVAVEFGRKGALGIGARVGGLGQMPGWWFTIESTSTSHLLRQFKTAIEEAIASPLVVRQKMRALSAKQRFPVAQWVEDLQILESRCIHLHRKVETNQVLHETAPRLSLRSHHPNASMSTFSSDDEDMPSDPKDPQRILKGPRLHYPSEPEDIADSQSISTRRNSGSQYASSVELSDSSEDAESQMEDDSGDVTVDASLYANEADISEEARMHRRRSYAWDDEADLRKTKSSSESTYSATRTKNSSEPVAFKSYQSGRLHTPTLSTEEDPATLVNSPFAHSAKFVPERYGSLLAKDFGNSVSESTDFGTSLAISDSLDKKLYKLKAQQLAGLAPDQDAEIIIYSGRWSMDNGIDVIADMIPSILESHPRTQFICVGPITDWYGRFADLKFQAITKTYPNRLYTNSSSFSVTELLLGSDFALQPARTGLQGAMDKTYERYGLLPIGSHLEGQTPRPGWWYDPISVAAQDLIGQLRNAVIEALGSTLEEREELRRAAASIEADWTNEIDTIQQNALATLIGRETNRSRSKSYASPDTGKDQMSEDLEIPKRNSSNEIWLSGHDIEMQDDIDIGGRDTYVAKADALDPSTANSKGGRHAHTEQGKILFAQATALVENAPLVPIRSSSLLDESSTLSRVGRLFTHMAGSIVPRQTRQWFRSKHSKMPGSDTAVPTNDMSRINVAEDAHQNFTRTSRLTNEDLHIPGRVSSVEVWEEKMDASNYSKQFYTMRPTEEKKPRKAIRMIVIALWRL